MSSWNNDPYETDFFGGCILFLLCLGLVGFLLKKSSDELDKDEAVKTAWCQKHNVTVSELQIFSRVMNVQPTDVMTSPGLQAEFRRFERGDLRQVGGTTIQQGKAAIQRNTFE